MAVRYKAELGQAIKRRREELGLTQSDLADRTHYKEAQSVSRWERGENLPRDLSVIAEALEWTLGELVAGIEPPDSRAARRLGIEPTGVTPDLMEDATGRRLQRIEQKLDRLLEREEEFVAIRERIAAALEEAERQGLLSDPASPQDAPNGQEARQSAARTARRKRPA
jgi:transcriptional regulator with XRE-family HTH domain